MQSDLCVLILAGGHSSRMEYPKAYLNTGDSILIEDIIDAYGSITNNIFVIINYEFAKKEWQTYIDRINKKAHIIINHHPEKGRFYSIRLGILQITDKNFCFIHNVDNPIKPETLKLLSENKNKNGYTGPSYNGKNGHPILISKKIMEEVMRTYDLDIHWNEFLSEFDKKIIPTPDGSILVNLNTKEDYRQFIKNE
jgi:CTP:molybdopterin cytidylyltransferase MocA